MTPTRFFRQPHLCFSQSHRSRLFNRSLTALFASIALLGPVCASANAAPDQTQSFSQLSTHRPMPFPTGNHSDRESRYLLPSAKSILPQITGGPWSALGPGSLYDGYENNSGRITAIAGDPTNASVLYIAAAGGGVWKTTNAGTSWTSLTDTQETLSMGAIAVAPSNSQIVYAGTGEASNSGDSFYGRGLLKSTNGGSTWTLITGNSGVNEFDRRCISQIAVDPTNANIVYIAVADFGVNGLSGNTGIWKTTDGGTTWTNTTTSISSEVYSDVVIDPSNDQTLYCAVGTLYGSTTNGVYKTTNGGTSWAAAGTFPIGGSDGRIQLAISKSSPSTVLAIIQDSSTYGLLNFQKSTDSGAHWSTITSAPDIFGGQGWYSIAVAIDPSNPQIFYAGGSSNGGEPNLIESTDGGTSWNDISSGTTSYPHTDEHSLVFDANGKLLSGSDGGIWRLDDPAVNNVNWTDLNGNIETIQFTGVALDPTSKSIVYGGSQDNGTEKTTGNVVWNEIVGGDGGFVRVDQTNPQTVYHTYSGVYIERSDDGGSTFTAITNGINTSDPSDFYPPYVMDPANSSRLLFGTDHLYETTDKGADWTAIASPATAGFNPNDNTIDDICVNGQTIYVGSGGHVFTTTDDGTTWTDVSVPSYADSNSDIFVNPSNAQNAFVTRPVFGGGHVFETINGGTAWTDISGDLPDLPANAIKVDTVGHVLYLGNDNGVYSSVNNGTNWTRLGTGLTNARVVDLALNTSLNVLVAGTHGRSAWEISLAQAAPTVTSFTPTSGPVGTVVTVTGTNLNGVTAVRFHNANAVTFSANAAGTQLTVTIPTGAGTGTFTVTTPGGSIKTTGTFTVIPAPTVTSFTPTSGPIGTVVTVTGTNLNGVTAVRFHDANAKTFSANAAGTQLTVTVPTGAATGTFTVTTPGGSIKTTGTFSVIPAPTVTSFAPTSGPIGTVVTVTGTNLNGVTAVRFHDANAKTFSANAAGTQLTVTVPTGAATGTFTVTTPGGSVKTTGTFTVTP